MDCRRFFIPAAPRFCRFFGYRRHTKIRLARRPFHLCTFIIHIPLGNNPENGMPTPYYIHAYIYARKAVETTASGHGSKNRKKEAKTTAHEHSETYIAKHRAAHPGKPGLAGRLRIFPKKIRKNLCAFLKRATFVKRNVSERRHAMPSDTDKEARFRDF